MCMTLQCMQRSVQLEWKARDRQRTAIMMFFAPMRQLYFYMTVMYASQDRELLKLQDSFFEYLLSENPEFASTIGDERFADRVDDYSMDTFDRWKVGRINTRIVFLWLYKPFIFFLFFFKLNIILQYIFKG